MPFGKDFRGGVRVAVGDVNGPSGDGERRLMDDVIVAQGNLGNTVKVYDGATTSVLQKLKVGGNSYRGGLNIGAGDVDADGLADIIAGRNRLSSPIVEVIKGTTAESLGRFVAFDRDFRQGVRVAAADVNFDGVADIIAGAGLMGESQVRIFDGRTNEELTSFTAFPKSPDLAVWTAGTTVIPVPRLHRETAA